MVAGAMEGAAQRERSNRRQLQRFSLDEDATLHMVNHGNSVVCRVVDISQGGCRLLTRERFQAGIMVRVEVNFKVRGLVFRFSGVTQWTDSRHQLGIRFVDVPSRRRQELVEALDELAAELAAKEAEQKTPEAPTEEATADLQEELATALTTAPEAERLDTFPAPVVQTVAHPFWRNVFSSRIQVTQREPAAVVPVEVPAAASEVSVLPEATKSGAQGPLNPFENPPVAGVTAAFTPTPRERRTQERHSVDTTATLFLVNIASRLGGRIQDLSLSGCRIRTDERFPVGIYTRIEIEFRLEGLPFRLGGVVQAIHDRHNIGIRFLDMSPRKHEQLVQLIEEIKEMYGETHEETQWSAKGEVPGEEA